MLVVEAHKVFVEFVTLIGFPEKVGKVARQTLEMFSIGVPPSRIGLGFLKV
jgi:hypothetical protein